MRQLAFIIMICVLLCACDVRTKIPASGVGTIDACSVVTTSDIESATGSTVQSGPILRTPFADQTGDANATCEFKLTTKNQVVEMMNIEVYRYANAPAAGIYFDNEPKAASITPYPVSGIGEKAYFLSSVLYILEHNFVITIDYSSPAAQNFTCTEANQSDICNAEVKLAPAVLTGIP